MHISTFCTQSEASIVDNCFQHIILSHRKLEVFLCLVIIGNTSISFIYKVTLYLLKKILPFLDKIRNSNKIFFFSLKRYAKQNQPKTSNTNPERGAGDLPSPTKHLN